MPTFLVTVPLVCKQTYRVEALTARLAIKKAKASGVDLCKTGEDNAADGRKLWAKAKAEEE